MQKYNPSKQKRDYDQDSIFDVEALNKLLFDFYRNILVDEYELNIVTETSLRERYVGMNDDSYGILPGEIMKIQAKHTRHLSMINLVYNGCNPMIIKEFAGHADERISANYYGNVTKTAKCITKILFDRYKAKDIKKKILHSYSRSPLSLFIDESGDYTPLDQGKCYSERFLKDDYSDCNNCGYDCSTCEFFIPDSNADIRIEADEIDEEMRLISTIIKRDDIDQKLTEYQTKYHSFQQKLGRYIEQTRRDLENHFCRTPYDFYHSRHYCPICITKDDIGAVNCDPEIAEYYADNRYPIDDISEHCDIDLQFKCPDCNSLFINKMTTMIKNPQKCPFCKAPQQEEQFNSSNDGFTYISLP